MRTFEKEEDYFSFSGAKEMEDDHFHNRIESELRMHGQLIGAASLFPLRTSDYV